jgi:hypothetical protein
MPLVNLTERPIKTGFGMRQRPHFEIIGWKTPGGDDKAIAAKPTTQISGPEATAASLPTAPPAPATASTSPQRQAKPPVQLSGYTLAAMGDVTPVLLSEELNDEIGF